MANTQMFGTCWRLVSRRRGVAVLAGALVLTAPLATADAGTQTLCRGYAACRGAGFSDAGYQANAQSSYWRMFAGPNCTNYVAYRLVRDGLGNERPAADPGQSNASLNAFAWGVAYANRTNAVPKPGSVAWWGANAGKGSIGHVAYVEQAHRDGSITISEDSSSGNGFAWKKLTPGQGWPQGFIHFGADNPRPVPVEPQRTPERLPAAKVRPGELGGDWAGGSGWGERIEPRRPERVRAVPLERTGRETILPKRSAGKKKAVAKRRAHKVVGKNMGGEVGGALAGQFGWQGSWGPGKL